MKKSTYKIITVVLVVVLVMLLRAGCARNSAKGAKSRAGGSVPVLAVAAVEKAVPVQLRAIGNVLPYAKVTIRSQITGQLEQAHFKEGQEVKQGDLLFTIDPRPSQAALEQAQANLARDEAQLANAKVQFDRSQKLYDSKVLSQGEYDNARVAMEAAQGTVLANRAAARNAELSLAYTEIRSPLDGVAGNQLVYAGNIVKSPDDEMLVINQVRPIYVSFAVPEQYLTEIKREMQGRTLKVSATFEGLAGAAPEGELTFVDNTVDTTTGTIQLKGTFGNTNSALWPGQFVQVELTLAKLPRAVVVPSQAVQTGQNGDYVFVVKADESVEMRPVKIGASHQGEIVVSEGLRAGERVVTDGQLNLVPGVKVEIKPAGGTTNAAPPQP